MLAMIQAAGWPIWLIIASSVAVVTIIIERALSLRKSLVLPEGLLGKVVQEYRTRGVTPEMLSQLSASSPLGRVLSAGLKNVRSSREIMKESIEEVGSVVAHDMDRYLSTLGTFAAVTPLLGLFGTVIGMIQAFKQVSEMGGAVKPAVLASGIWMALLTTAEGLIVAIAAFLMYHYLQHLVGRIGKAIAREAEVKILEYGNDQD